MPFPDGVNLRVRSFIPKRRMPKTLQLDVLLSAAARGMKSKEITELIQLLKQSIRRRMVHQDLKDSRRNANHLYSDLFNQFMVELLEEEARFDTPLQDQVVPVPVAFLI